jgi:hypothetical protein
MNRNFDHGNPYAENVWKSGPAEETVYQSGPIDDQMGNEW